MTNLKAVLAKRAHIYKRSRRYFLFETLIPGLLIIIGVIISKWSSGSKQNRSEPRNFEPELLPWKQKILMNTTPIDLAHSDVGTEVLAANLPRADDAFDVSFDRTKRTKEDNYMQFAWSVFDFGQQLCYAEPYLYASYDIFQASKLSHNYKFVAHVNTTSQDVAVLVPQFMYESILKTATEDNEFEFKVTSHAFATTWQVQTMVKVSKAGTIVFFTAIAYSIVLTNIVSHLVTERVSNLKHVQQISGMKLSAYWVGNFIFDFAKLTITIAISIATFLLFDTGL